MTTARLTEASLCPADIALIGGGHEFSVQISGAPDGTAMQPWQQALSASYPYALDASKRELEPFELVQTPRLSRPGQVLQQRAEPIAFAAAADLEASNRKARIIGVGIGFLACKYGLGRTSVPTMATAWVTMSTLEMTQSVSLTALTAGATTLLWSRAVAGVTSSAIDHYPQTFKATGETFPKLSETLTDVLPGFAPLPKKPELSPAASRRQRIGRIAVRGLRNVQDFVETGISASLKITPYLCAAGRAGRSKAERNALAWKLSIGAAAMRAATFGSAAASIIDISKHDPDLAMRMQHDIKNPLAWILIGYGLSGKQLIMNKLRRRKAAQKDVDQNAKLLETTEASAEADVAAETKQLLSA